MSTRHNKAIAGFIVALVVSLLVKYQVDVSLELKEALQALVEALIIALGVWLSPRNKDPKDETLTNTYLFPILPPDGSESGQERALSVERQARASVCEADDADQ